MAVRHQIKVLVIDDDVTVCETVAMILEEAGFVPKHFSDPREAIKEAETEAYRIAILDQKMPEMNGLELVERLKHIDSRLCCIVMTGYPDLQTATAMMRRGTADYIIKPFKKKSLLAAVERACESLGLIYRCEADLNRLIGQRIRSERQRQSLTLRQISQRSDLTTSQLSQVELGKNAASLWALARISNALGLQLSTLLNGL